MKKIILLIMSMVLLVVDILLAGLFWKNYTYHIGDIDVWSIGWFIVAAILMESLIVLVHYTKEQDYLLHKIVISVSLLFIFITCTYKIYNDSVHYDLKYENVELVRTSDRDLGTEEIKEFVELFNSAKYIKRNSSCEVEGTPDKTITVFLSDEERISLHRFGEQIAVWVSGRKNEDSYYWMEQKDISKMLKIMYKK
ncbi:MAG: hypothetical protein IJC76_08675 [Lachnospiraceae bacterium]|nr:hypothetical protein [Lachnospiraceae bacterium]